MRAGFPPRGVFCGTPGQNAAVQELLPEPPAAAGLWEEFTQWGPGSGETPHNSECPPRSKPSSFRCAHPLCTAELHPPGHSLHSESQVSIMKNQEGENMGFCFPPWLFFFAF